MKQPAGERALVAELTVYDLMEHACAELEVDERKEQVKPDHEEKHGSQHARRPLATHGGRAGKQIDRDRADHEIDPPGARYEAQGVRAPADGQPGRDRQPHDNDAAQQPHRPGEHARQVVRRPIDRHRPMIATFARALAMPYAERPDERRNHERRESDDSRDQAG